MICKRYKNALTEDAAAGTEPGAELRTHLGKCPSCRAAFEQERSLFAAIDAGLRSSVNAQVPLSFLPRVRARIMALSALPHSWASSRRMLFAIAATAITVFFFGQIRRLTRIEQGEKVLAKREATSDVVSPASPSDLLNPVSAPITASIVEKRRNGAAVEIHRRTPQRETSEPEILVPPDQEILLSRFADQLRRRNSAPLMANEADQAQIPLLQVDLIQIAQLDVKPLAEEQQ